MDPVKINFSFAGCFGELFFVLGASFGDASSEKFEVAGFLDLSAAEVLDTASFYEEYWLSPKGKYVVWVCQSISCELLGQVDLLNQIKQKLGIDVGETTADGRFTLMTVECLGSCGTAPCALVNEKLYENITTENFENVLDGLD